MFKFVALFALLAAASATPDIVTPLTYSSNLFAPTTGVVAGHSGLVYSSPIIPSSPLTYGAWGYPHYIKKRSLALNSYVAPGYFGAAPLATTYAGAPFATTYGAIAPLGTTYAAAGPLATTYSSSFYSTPAHLIKKRAAPVIVPSTYVSPSIYPAGSPFLPSTYAAGPFVSSPLYSSAPFAYNAHFIK